MSPSPMLPPSWPRTPAGEGDVQIQGRSEQGQVACVPPGPCTGCISPQPPVLLYPDPSDRGRLRGPCGAGSGTVMVAQGVCSVTPDLEDILVPI